MSAWNKPKDPGVDLEQLQFYFDAVAKDRYDQGMLGRRSGQVLALREKLLNLQEGDFDMAIRTIEKLVSDMPRTPTLTSKQNSENNRNARMLYEKVETNPSSSERTRIEKI